MGLYRGIVVNNNSPTKDGRVQVRIFALHPDEVKDADLPWSEVMQTIEYIGYHSTDKFDSNEKSNPTNPLTRQSGSRRAGFGKNIILEIGTWVFCDLDHDNPNMPIVVGTIASHNEINPNSSPTNKHILETISGHYQEFSDTQGSETIRTHHRSGTDITYMPDGTLNTYITKDEYTHILKNSLTKVEQDKVEIINKDYTRQIQGSDVKQVAGDQLNTSSGICRITADTIFLN
jgi:possible base plate lysozyme|nr:MAG TPA: baseplate wedge protein [Caudoviricetes sp.]DAY17465.1 MAG TPA: baseplate wedge protein [Caudoviricetes sp.]